MPENSVPFGKWLGVFAFFFSDRREACVGPCFREGARALERRNGIMKTFINMLRDDSGASAAEYALILAIIGAAIAIAAIALGNAIAGAMNHAANCVGATSSATYAANCA